MKTSYGSTVPHRSGGFGRNLKLAHAKRTGLQKNSSSVVNFLLVTLAALSICLIYSGLIYAQHNTSLSGRGVSGINPIKPAIVHVIFVVLTVVLISARGAWKKASVIPREFIVFALGYSLYMILQWTIEGGRNSVTSGVLVQRLVYCCLLLNSLLLFSAVGFGRACRITALGLLWFSISLNLVEFFLPSALPVQLTSIPGRAAGLYEQPNVSALMICFLFAVLAPKTGTVSFAALSVGSLLGIFVTFSREGWMIFSVLMAIAICLRTSRRLLPLLLAVVVVIGAPLFMLAVFADLPELLRQLLGSNLSSDTVGRLYGGADASMMERAFVLREGLAAWLSAPIFGHGVGYTWNWDYLVSVHNMAVLMLAEHGLVGFALLIVFWLGLVKLGRPYGLMAGAVFLAAIPFNHNLFDSPYFIALPALAMAASGASSGGVRTLSLTPGAARQRWRAKLVTKPAAA